MAQTLGNTMIWVKQNKQISPKPKTNRSTFTLLVVWKLYTNCTYIIMAHEELYKILKA